MRYQGGCYYCTANLVAVNIHGICSWLLRAIKAKVPDTRGRRRTLPKEFLLHAGLFQTERDYILAG